MYKYESYLKEVLLRDGEVSFAQIGLFTVGKEPLVQETGAPSPMQQVVFQYNKKAETSENLVLYVAEKEKKNRQIVAMDIESYFNEMRQLVNTGKEFAMQGIGYLFINKQGDYEFVQQVADSPKKEEYNKKQSRLELPKTPVAKKAAGRNATTAAALIIVILVVAAAAGGFFYWNYKNQNRPAENAVVTPVDDSLSQPANTPVKKAIDSIATGKDSTMYKFIFETTGDGNRAHTRIATLRGYGDAALLDSVRTDTATLYHLYVSKKILPKDSAYVKDSLQKYFQRNILIEKQMQ